MSLPPYDLYTAFGVYLKNHLEKVALGQPNARNPSHLNDEAFDVRTAVKIRVYTTARSDTSSLKPTRQILAKARNHHVFKAPLDSFLGNAIKVQFKTRLLLGTSALRLILPPSPLHYSC